MTSNDTADPTATSRPELWLRECLYMMEPMARMMVANGVTYPMLAQSLKRVFLDAAEQELNAHDRKITDSALSLLSGVHRKDVRTLAATSHEPLSRTTSIASDVVMRWISEDEYVDKSGQPRVLNIRCRVDESTQAVSFERLAQSVSKDFHARSVLDELERLGVVKVEGGQVRLVLSSGFVASADIQETLGITAANVHDHLAAGSANLAALHAGERPPFLEYAMWATELSEPSVKELALLTKRAWFSTMRRVAKRAVELEQRDRAQAARATARLRFGAYVFHEDPVLAAGPPT